MKTTRILAKLLMLIGVLWVAIEVSAADRRIAAYSVYKVGARLDGGGALLGPAVLLAPGKLVTSCRTTKEAGRIVVLHREGEIPARGAQTSPRQDLCLLLVPELRGPAPERRPSSQLQVGEAVIAIGYGQGYRPYVNEGHVSALYSLDGAHVIWTTAEFPRGASGESLFGDQGRLVGVLTFGETIDEPLNYAVPTARRASELLLI